MIKAKQLKPEPTQPDVQLTLSMDEARRLRRLVGCNVSIPKALSNNRSEGYQSVYRFLGRVCNALSSAGIDGSEDFE